MEVKDILKEAQFGTPICRAVLKIEVRRESFRRNSLGDRTRDLEYYGVAIRAARSLTEAPAWHYTDRGNLVCGEGRNMESLPLIDFTIVIDANLEFLNRMCPCENKGAMARKFFAVGAAIVGLDPGEKLDKHAHFRLILGNIQE